MKRLLALALIVPLLLNVTGCETMRKKFTRKKKAPVKAPRIYQVKRYEVKPTPELYKKHYVHWMTWHSELLRVLGENHKKDLSCMEGITSNLNDMRNILVPEKGDVLKTHIDKLLKVRQILISEDLTTFNKDYIRRVLEAEDRAIKREFSYDKVKDSLKVSFEDEDVKE